MRAGDALPPSVPLSFSNCFWGKDEKGVDILLDRISDAKSICDEVKTFYRERAAAEEEYAKKLLKLSRMSLGSKELGTLKASLNAVKMELEAMGNAHTEVAAAMRKELEDALNTHVSRWREKRKLAQTNIEKLRRMKQAQEQQLKEKYEADCIKVNGFIAQQNMLMGKELEKNNTKLEKSQMAVQASNNDYKAAVKVLQETTHRWIVEWKKACDQFQDLEEERIDFVKSNLWTYANIMATACVSDDDSCERIRVMLEKVEVDEVIQTFIHAKGTGQEIPDPPRYRNFYRKDDHDDDVGYKVAQFSRDSNPQYRSSTPQFPPSDDESTMRPMTGVSMRHEDRPMTGMARNEDQITRPLTGISVRHDERPATGIPRAEESPVRPNTGVSQRPHTSQDPRSPSRGRPATMSSIVDAESSPPSHRSRSRVGSQSPLKGIINEYPPEGITQFCRQDSGARRTRHQGSRRSSSSSTYSPSETPTNSTSDSSLALGTPVRSLKVPPNQSSNVLQRRDRSESQTPSEPSSPAKKSLSFWNFGSKSAKQNSQKTLSGQPSMKNLKPAPTGMAMSIPSLEIGGGRNARAHSERGGLEDPIAPGSSVMLNIGCNVLEVNNPDTKSAAKPVEPVDEMDPLVAALENLKMAAKAPRTPSPTKRSPAENTYQATRGPSRDVADAPLYDNPPPSRQEQTVRPSVSQNMRQSQTPPSRGGASHVVSRASPPSEYDNRRSTLDAPPPAHSAAEMERTRRQYAGQMQQVLGGPTRPSTSQIPVRSVSPRPTSRELQHADDSYNGRPSSSMSMHRQEPPRSRSPAPGVASQGYPPRSRSPAPIAPQMSRQDMDYARSSNQEYDPVRRNVSPGPFQQPPRGYEDMRRSPSPQPYARSTSPAPMSARPRSSATMPGNNPFGISLDRYGNVVDSNVPTGYERTSSRPGSQHAYGSHHRHDIDEPARHGTPAHMRSRSKSYNDLRSRPKFTEDGGAILFMAKALYDYTAAIPEECSFRKGDVVYVTRTQDDGWWAGEIAGSRPLMQGLVPSNFFKTISQN